MYTLNLTRSELCDLLVATTAAYHESRAEKWKFLHDEIKKQLDEQDKSKK